MIDLAKEYEDLLRRYRERVEELYAAARHIDNLEEKLALTDPQLQELTRLKFEQTQAVEAETIRVKQEAGRRAQQAQSRYYQEVAKLKGVRGRLNEAIHLLKHAKFFGHPDHPKVHPRILETLIAARRALT